MNQNLLAEFCLDIGYSLEKIKSEKDTLHIQKKQVLSIFLFGNRWSKEKIGSAIGETAESVDRLIISFFEEKREWQKEDLVKLNNPFIPNEKQTPAFAKNPK